MNSLLYLRNSLPGARNKKAPLAEQQQEFDIAERGATCRNPKGSKQTVRIEDDRTATSVEALRRAILDNLFYTVGASQQAANDQEFFMAVAYTVRDRLLARWLATLEFL